MVQRILIMGASGSGKSTLGAALAQALKYRYADTDTLYWVPSETPFERKRDRDQQFELVKDVLSQPGGQILSGSFSGWGDLISPFVDAVIWLRVPMAIRMERLRAREYERYGEAILPGGERYAISQRFLTWAAAYDDGLHTGRRLARDAEWFKDLTCPTLSLNGERPFDEQLDAAISWLRALD